MRSLCPRAFVFLFTLLQCIAPLLHGHVHAAAHAGMHMHAMGLTMPGAPPQSWAQPTAEDADAAMVAVGPALEPRGDGEPVAVPMAVAASGICPDIRQCGLTRPYRVVLPAPPSHLIPLPGAPPGC